MCSLRFIVCLVLVIGGCSSPRPELEQSKQDDTENRKPRTGLGTAMLATLREPAPGEFSSPEAVVRHLLEAIRDHDVDEYLKCFPTRLKLEKLDLQTQIRWLEAYSPDVRRLPGDTYFNLQGIISAELSRFYGLTFAMLFEGEIPRAESIDPDSPKGADRIAEILRTLDLSRLKKMKIGDITPRKQNDGPIPQTARILGATDFIPVDATVKCGDEEIKLLVFVGKFGKHWRVHLVLPD